MLFKTETFPTGWYDSVYDQELGSQPCIFTSVTPVSMKFSRAPNSTEIGCLGVE